MNIIRRAPALALVVPFYNEEHHLPRLIDSLRKQNAENVPVVFIDNASTDSSTALVQRCEEIKAGRWTCLVERRVGKFHAMKTATVFCMEQLGSRYIGFLDADSYCADDAWVHDSVGIVQAAQRHFGYTYSPIIYFGFEQLPDFTRAYHAFERVRHFLTQNVGWLINGQGFVCSAEILRRYFQHARVTTEIDLRCSLLALSDGLRAYFNPTPIMSSGRRIIVNPKNFAAWCFYERQFYTKKDINAQVKLNLDAPGDVQDLRPEMVGQFFQRRAVKSTCRHLIPFAIFDRSALALERIRTVLGIDVAEQIGRSFRRFKEDADFILTHRFETMIKAIERHPASTALANHIEHLMREDFVGSGRETLVTPDLPVDDSGSWLVSTR
jgi:glycosyltransferase involved in cell wall biosynthesis